MINLFRSIKKLTFLEIYFRMISLLFWPIYWYKWIVITIQNYNQILFNIYFVLDIIFIIFLLLKRLFKKEATKWYFYFMFFTAITYLISLLSLMILPRDISILYLKIILCIVLMIVSWKLIKREYNDIGVVGILSGLLILLLTYFY